MSRIEESVYEDWRTFKNNIIQELFDETHFQREIYIFRGQSNSDWKLEPSFDRTFYNLSTNDKNEAMKEMLRIFRYECEGMDVPEALWTDEIKALALGQHYGLPTRLLDWTDSPYIAAFFAFSDAISNRAINKYVSIWALDTRVDAIWNEESGVKIINVPSIGNMRLRNQYGKFTLLKTPFNCLEDYVTHFREEIVPLKKYLIASSSARDAISDLDAMGINHSRIYPELIGCALSAKIRVMLGKNIR
jgi:hypothetical protein